ncbi:MAG: NAD(P)H-binding protein [Gammaproteobacteria bacterium]|nr:NAD(P)H-binding protein [Gammaproteobacteria bacterium]MDH5344956.1 NAD(P)H-binding protein [Gammaproteobacteria bacterium]
MRVALFGGTGFVGGYLVDALLAAGHEPSLLVRGGSDGKVRQAGGCRVTTGAVGTGESVESTLDGCQAVIYNIGILRENRAKGVTFEALQFDGAVRVADCASRSGIRRFLLMSANGVHSPGTAYQETKFRAECHILESDFDATVFRPSVIFGDPRGHMEFATQLNRDMVAPPLPAVAFHNGIMRSGGDVVMSPVHVEDVALAFVRALNDPGTIGRTYALGGPEVLTWRQILERIMAATSRRKVILPMPIPVMKAAAALLDWLPAFPVTRDQLTMLAEGNTADPGDLRSLIGREPTPMNAVTLSYLSRNAPGAFQRDTN